MSWKPKNMQTKNNAFHDNKRQFGNKKMLKSFDLCISIL